MRDPACLFCGVKETRDHFFFECSYSSQVWRTIVIKLGKCGVIPNTCADIMDWSIHALKRCTTKNFLVKLGFHACIYHVWLERNTMIHIIYSKSDDALALLVLQDIRLRIISLPKIQAACIVVVIQI